MWQRTVLVAGGMCLVFPGLWNDISGAVLAGIVIVAQLIERRATQAKSAN
jgi:hypothetical protein